MTFYVIDVQTCIQSENNQIVGAKQVVSHSKNH
jgi:hypothetical protein